MDFIHDNIDEELDLIKHYKHCDDCIPPAIVIFEKIHQKSYQRRINGTRFKMVCASALAVLAILTSATLFMTDNAEENNFNREQYIKSIATSYSIDYNNIYTINNQ
jgi:hypothetical protein